VVGGRLVATQQQSSQLGPPWITDA